MNKIVKIYCEGKAGSNDFDVISKVIDGLPVIIVPVGGKKGAKSAIQVYENGITRSDYKIFFRDRDFDISVPSTESLTSDGTYVYFSYRTTIENYLIDIDTIEKFSEGKSWYSETLNENFIEAARQIKYFQAMRHTLGALRVSTDFGTNIMNKSGLLPNNLSKEYCQKKGFQKIKESLSKTKDWNEENYNLEFEKFISIFSDSFLEEGAFLVYFQGKDFMKSLCKQLSGFSPKDYYKFAKANFDYKKYKDLKELRTLIEREI